MIPHPLRVDMPYLTDEKTADPYSVGPDGKSGTEDDIKLGDWPS